MNHNQPENKNHGVIYCQQTIWVSEKKKFPQFYISLSYYLHPIIIPFISQDCSGRSETFVAELQYQISVLNLSVLRVKASFISNAKEIFYFIQFLYTLLVNFWKQFHLSHKCKSNMEILWSFNFKVHGQNFKFYKSIYTNLFLDIFFFFKS